MQLASSISNLDLISRVFTVCNSSPMPSWAFSWSLYLKCDALYIPVFTIGYTIYAIYSVYAVYAIYANGYGGNLTACWRSPVHCVRRQAIGTSSQSFWSQRQCFSWTVFDTAGFSIHLVNFLV